jgi:hypothetical protein
MTLAPLHPEAVGVYAAERRRCSRAQLAWASLGLLPPLCALVLALLPPALRVGIAAILCGGAVLLCCPVLLGRLLDAPPRKPGPRALPGRHLDGPEDSP